MNFFLTRKNSNFKLMVLCEKKYVKNNKNLEKSVILWEYVWWHLESMSRTGSTRKMKKCDFFRFIYKEKKLTICRKSLIQSYIIFEAQRDKLRTSYIFPRFCSKCSNVLPPTRGDFKNRRGNFKIIS